MRPTPVDLSYKEKRWRRPDSYAFAAKAAMALLVAAEFPKAAASMPIGFIEKAGRYEAVAIMAPEPGYNLFVGPAGQWLGDYVPAVFRSYPFTLSRIKDTDRFGLCVDEDSNLVTDQEGEPFFDADDKASPAIIPIQDLLLRIENERTATDLAVKALADAGLMQPWPFEATSHEKRGVAKGLYRVNGAALAGLDDDAFLKLRRSEALPLAYMQLTSMAQLAVFERMTRIQKQLARAQQKKQIASLDEIFKLGNDDTLRFN